MLSLFMSPQNRTELLLNWDYDLWLDRMIEQDQLALEEEAEQWHMQQHPELYE